MRIASLSIEVVAKQNVPGKLAQSALTLQPGAQTSPDEALATHAFGRFSALPPPAPRPAQSDDRAQGLVHPSAHVSPAMHALASGLHGSPTPLSVHTTHFESTHVVSASRSAMPVGDWPSQAATHADRPPQFCSQFERFWHATSVSQAASGSQPLAFAHWAPGESSALTTHPRAAAPPSAAGPPPPPAMVGAGQLASMPEQLPRSGGCGVIAVHAAHAAKMSQAKESASRRMGVVRSSSTCSFSGATTANGAAAWRAEVVRTRPASP